MHSIGKPLALWAATLTLGCSLGAAIQGSFDRTLKVDGPVDLLIETDSGGIVVRGGAEGEVQIKGTVSVSRRLSNAEAERKLRAIEQTPPISQDNGRIRIGRGVGDRELQRNLSVTYEIIVPTQTELKSSSDSGGQTIEDLSGPVNARADSGGLRIHNIGAKVTARSDSGGQKIDSIVGHVDASADSGGLKISNVSGSVSAQTDSGSINAEDVAGGFRGRADSGSIRVSQTAPGDVSIHTDSGSIKIRTAPEAGYDINIRTDSGGINMRTPTDGLSVRRNRVEGKIRGGGQRLDASADSGSVTVD